MKISFSSSFATRLSIYVLSFTLIGIVSMIVLFYRYSRERITEHAVEYTQGMLDNVATKISGELQVVETIIKQSVWMVDKNLNNPDSLYNVIYSVVRNNDLIVGSGIAFIPNFYEEKGKHFMPYASFKSRNEKEINYQVLGGSTYDYPCMDWFLIPKLLKKSHWSEPYYDTGGGNRIMTTYSLPLFNEQGEVYAVFTADVSLSQFTNVVNSLKPYQSSFTFLISRNGCFLSHPDRDNIMNKTIFSNAFEEENKQKEEIGYKMIAGETGTAQIIHENQQSYIFYTVIPNTGWSMATIYPGSVILQQLDTASYRILYIFLIGVLILFPLLFHTIHKLVRPLKQFSESARVIATGRFDVLLPEVRIGYEIKNLRDSLAYMQKSLSAYIEELRATTTDKERIESELNIARDIQMGMIPKTFPPYPDRHDVDLHAVLKPAKEVGGDLYDFFIRDNHLYFVIGDVSGKGVPASLFMAIARSLFRTLSQQGSISPAEIMSQMNRSISDSNETNMFITLIIGILDLETGQLRYCNAGHNPPILIDSKRNVSLLKTKAQLFAGVFEDMEYTFEEITLEKGSRLFLYTDGITEAENEAKELYGEDRLLKILSEIEILDVRKVVDVVMESVTAHVQQAEPSDDLTILLLHYYPEK